MNGLLLGLSGGVACLMYCAPTILPFYLSKGDTIKKNYQDLTAFLLGRLMGYLLFGILAWIIGRFILEAGPFKKYIMGGAYVLMALMLILTLFIRLQCPIKRMEPLRARLSKFGPLFPAFMGFATGVNLCPTFLLVFTEASGMASILESMGFFLLFFLGTAIYFLPLPLVGLFKGRDALKTLGRFMAAYISLYYIYKGITLFLGFGGA